jgi:hypothetical protein
VSEVSLPAGELTAHQPPALLVERVVALTAEGGRVRLAAHQGLDALQLLEACAQAVAALAGARARTLGGGRAGGMLVGASAFAVARSALAGEAVAVEATLAHRLGALELHRVRARSIDMDIELAGGELSIAIAPVGAGP